MSKYTTLLRNIVEGLQRHSGDSGYACTYKSLGLDAYPIFEQAYRAGLNDKIIEHFYFREIGFETAGMFRFYLRRTMNEVMPLYNQRYNSAKLEISPLLTHNRTVTDLMNEDSTSNVSGSVADELKATSTTGQTETANNRNVESDTPQGLLSMDNIEGEAYATKASIDKTAGTSNSDEHRGENRAVDSASTSDANRRSTNTHTETGFDGSQAELLKIYRTTFLNIDMEVIHSLDDLFMLIY